MGEESERWFVADRELAALAPQMTQRIDSMAAELCSPEFRRFFSQPTLGLFDTVAEALGADDWSVWLVDAGEEHLVPRYSGGPRAGEFVDRFRQPLDRGMISTVFATGRGIVEHEVFRQADHDGSLDRQLGVRTVGMAAVPLYFAGSARGVVTAVKLAEAEAAAEADPFGPRTLEFMEALAACIESWVDVRLMRATLGIELL